MNWERVEDHLVQILAESIASPDLRSSDKLEAAFRVAAAYAAARLKPVLAERLAGTVASGPFAGMRLLDRASEGAYVPKLLGSYEAELHPWIEEISASDYDTVINIGCAEGFYAVGLARRTAARIFAFDIDPNAQFLCGELARLNGVEDRVTVSAGFERSDFASFADRRVLVVCDIEGDEEALLDPADAPSLCSMDVVLEIHRVDNRWTSETVFPRFQATHSISEVGPKPRSAARYDALEGLSDRERFFALLERTEETRWAFLRARSDGG